MNDPRDPYNTPPAPERFAPPEPVSPDPVAAGPADPPGAFERRPAEELLPFDPPAGTPPYEPGMPEERVPLGPPVAALEPLPASVGHFGAPPEPDAQERVSLSSRLIDEFVAWLKTLASAAVYATLIVTFGFQVARVEGQSMAPTLEDQDRLIVNKLAYRLGDPQVGDIVMLYYPLNPDKSFVKRVIAGPGQTVKIVDGRVYVNDVLLDDSFVPQEYRSHEDYAPRTIDEGYYFVMGDHRNNSSDSRHWGLVPKKYIIGRVQLRWWPVPDARTF
ncbi:MAG TPA: signal peptidase I [Vicinamibacterales bacterium]|nr:signal peptidase I [Vicinamibacterales bacterium]